MIQSQKPKIRSRTGRLRSAGAVTVVGIGLLVGTVYAAAPVDLEARDSSWWRMDGWRVAASGSQGVNGSATVDSIDLARLPALADRVERVNGAWAGLLEYYESEIAPIERVLVQYRPDSVLARRIAVALVREANRAELEPRLLLAVLLVENPWLEPEIRSPVGAIGLMQVMPFHRGAWSQCGPDLEDIDANICHGAQIFAHYFELSGGDLDRALLRYNGCVNGTNTPDCHQYPNHVFANAGRASVMTWLGRGPAAGSP